MPKRKIDDLIGKQFGRLTVLQPDYQKMDECPTHQTWYKCQCNCGNTKSIRRNALVSGMTVSCGCKVREASKSRYIDLTGQRFGKLTITRRKQNDPNDPVKDRRSGVWWYADCDCGTKDYVCKGNYLRAGRTVSCGCYNSQASHDKNMVDITGQRYGMLTVIEEVKDANKQKRSKSIMWRCICDCGNETIVSSNALRTGGTVSCGCISSKNEMRIRDHLDRLSVKYIKQYWFEDLRSPITNWVLKFDVAVFDGADRLSFLIEYDGEQHQSGTRFSPSQQVNEEKFRRTQMYDEMKNQYCKDHNIDLLRISYRDKDRLLDIIDEKLKQKGLI